MTGLEPVPTPEVLSRSHALWDSLADFEVAEGDAALLHLLRGVADLVSAQNAYFLGAVRLLEDHCDGLRGWRPRVVRYLHSSTADEAFARKQIRETSQGGFDESSQSHARAAGRFRVSVLRELVSPDWFESPMYKFGYEPRGIVDGLWVVFPVHEGAEAYYAFHRSSPAGLFTSADKAVAAYAIRGLKWFHRHVMLNHGLLVAHAPLAPTERRVMRLLLTGMTEKQIADRLRLTLATTHKYVTDIFRKFGVSGRAALTSLWLGGAAARATPAE